MCIWNSTKLLYSIGILETIQRAQTFNGRSALRNRRLKRHIVSSEAIFRQQHMQKAYKDTIYILKFEIPKPAVGRTSEDPHDRRPRR